MTKTEFPKEAANNNEAPEDRLNSIVGELQELPVAHPLSKNELKSIRSIIAYLAFNNGVEPDVIKTKLEIQYGVDDYSKINSPLYDEIIQYLVDMNIREAIH